MTVSVFDFAGLECCFLVTNLHFCIIIPWKLIASETENFHCSFMPNVLPTLIFQLLSSFPGPLFSFSGLFSSAVDLMDFLILHLCAISRLCSQLQPHILLCYFSLFTIPNLGPATKSVYLLFPTLLSHKGIKMN